jgi:outer membrane protein assembly factor BamB
LQLNNIVNAYDLAERKALWSYNLHGKNPLYAANPHASIMMNHADGKLTVVHQDGRQERLGGVAVVRSSYVCLQTPDGLVALDLTRPGPSVLWTKSGVPVKGEIFGDDEHIYVVETGGDGVPTTTRALRAQDGVSVGVPEFGHLFAKRIRILGRHLLLQEDDSSGGKVCRLYDVHAGRDVWRQSFEPGAIVSSSHDPNYTAIVEKDQTVTLLDVRSGRTVFRSLIQADHADRLQAVSLISDRDRFYLALLREKDAGMEWTANLINGLRSIRVNGPVYALDRSTGKLEWICDFLPHQNLLLEQIRDLPVMLFTAMYSRVGRNGAYGNSTKVTAIDKRNGKLIFDKEFAQVSPFLSVRTDPQAGSIELLRNDLKIAFRTDDSVATADPVLPRRPLSSSPAIDARPAPIPINQ